MIVQTKIRVYALRGLTGVPAEACLMAVWRHGALTRATTGSSVREPDSFAQTGGNLFYRARGDRIRRLADIGHGKASAVRRTFELALRTPMRRGVRSRSIESGEKGTTYYCACEAPRFTPLDPAWRSAGRRSRAAGRLPRLARGRQHAGERCAAQIAAVFVAEGSRQRPLPSHQRR